MSDGLSLLGTVNSGSGQDEDALNGIMMEWKGWMDGWDGMERDAIWTR